MTSSLKNGRLAVTGGDAPARVRTTVPLPVSLSGGFTTTAHLVTFDGLVDGRDHVALALGHTEATPLVRLHSECLTGDVLGSARCDCGAQLHEAVRRISRAGGYLLYLRQEGRGIGLTAKIDAYALQDRGLDTYEANVALGYPEDARDYTVAAQMLAALGEPRVRLLTNNPHKVRQLAALGVAVDEQVPTGVHVSSDNRRYLTAKATHGTHRIDLGA